MHCIGHLGWKLKSLISGNFSHLFNKFLPSIFFVLFCLLFSFSLFFSLLFGRLLTFDFQPLSFHIFNYHKHHLILYLLKLSLDKIFVFVTGHISHSIFEVFFYSALPSLFLWLFWFLILHILKCLEMTSLLLTFPSRTLKADWEMFIPK